MTQTTEQRISRRLQQEFDEFQNDRVRLQQAQIDTWFEGQLDLLEEEMDVYECGGFLERWSQTPSYTKSRRDRDFRVR
jgi:hypothetical protein